MFSKSKRIALLACVAGWMALAAPGLAQAQEAKPLKLTTTADHTKFKELQREFSSGPEVTKACLSCHTEAAGQIHRTKHWKWEYLNPETKQMLGKKTRHQQLLHLDRVQRSRLQQLPHRLRLERCQLRLQVRRKRRLPGLPRHHRQLQEAAGLGRQRGHQGHRVPARLGQDHQGHRSDQDRPEGRQVQPRHLRRLPLQRRRRRRRQARRHGQFAGGAGQGAGRAHGRRRPGLHLRHLPQDLQPRCGRQPLHPDRQGRKGAHMRGARPTTAIRPPACPATARARTRRTPCSTSTPPSWPARPAISPTFARGGIATKMSWDWSTAGKRDADGKQIEQEGRQGTPHL